MRSVGVVTGARSDYGIYRPILRAIEAAEDMELRLYVTGMHLSPEFGRTVDEIRKDGFPIACEVESLDPAGTPEAVARSIARGVEGFSRLFASAPPDLLLVLGDRYEMFAAAVAALPFNLPIAHMYGGESTEWVIDEAIRHSLTKFSHVHFVSTQTYASRIIRMGEAPERVHVVGAASLDNLRDLELRSRAALTERYGVSFERPVLLATYHPVTLETSRTDEHLDEFFAALDDVPAEIVFTYPNADTHGRRVLERVRAFVESRPHAHLFENLGTRDYFSFMAEASAMVGNSSSGIIEAASFRLPVVNVGRRQQGRLRPANVLDAEPTREAISSALTRALSKSFRASLKDLTNPYGDGRAAERIVSVLRTLPLDETLLVKRFYEPSPGR